MTQPAHPPAVLPKLIAGSDNLALAQSIARRLNGELVGRTIRRFPDGELQVELGDAVRGDDVYVIQPTGPRRTSRSSNCCS